MIVNFGKHKGQTVQRISENDYRYAQWAAKEVKDVVVRNAFAAEIARIKSQSPDIIAAKIESVIHAQGENRSIDSIKSGLLGINATKQVTEKMQKESPEISLHFKKIFDLWQSDRLTSKNFVSQERYEKAIAFCEEYTNALIAEDEADDWMSFYSNYEK